MGGILPGGKYLGGNSPSGNSPRTGSYKWFLRIILDPSPILLSA